MPYDGVASRSRAVARVARIAHATGLVSLGQRWAGRGRAQILIYHRVNDEGDPYFGGIPTSRFERQMAYLADRYDVLPLADLVAGLRSGGLPPRAVAITLDDGYRDNFENAFPIFRRHSIPATIFLTTAAIGTDRPIWHDEVFSAFRETAAARLTAFGPDGVEGPLDSVPGRLAVQQRVLGFLRRLPDAERHEWVQRLRDALGVGPMPATPGLMLSWDDVRAMSREGIDFGSHTVSHPILSRVDRARAERELRASKAEIEERVGRPVRGFAYPNGTAADFLPETKEILRDAGYAYAVTTIAGTNEAATDAFELKRATPWDDDVFAFGLRMLYNRWRS
jgi:peptidoglycan/xylan/chitin deacetylase (PgdA/CDA1 family)